MKSAALGVILGAVALAGCTTTTASRPVDVTRFHLGAPLERGTVKVEAAPGGEGDSLEFQAYADAVRSQLLASGYTAPDGTTPAQYLAVVTFRRASQAIEPARSPVSVGLGGGGFSGGRGGGGLGLGGGISFPIGKARARSVVASELAVQLRRRADGTVIWEGRAQTAADERAADAQIDAAAAKMARALFLGFPGESGRSISVK